MVEVKTSMDEKLSANLEKFSELVKPKHIFQVAVEGNFVDQDVFQQLKRPLIIPARTFLSQLQ